MCLVIFFDFGALGGPGFRASGCRVQRLTPKTKVFSKDSGGFCQVEGSPPLVGASGAPKINIFFPQSTKIQYFFTGAPKMNIFCPRSTKNQYFLSLEHEKLTFSFPEHQDCGLRPTCLTGRPIHRRRRRSWRARAATAAIQFIR